MKNTFIVEKDGLTAADVIKGQTSLSKSAVAKLFKDRNVRVNGVRMGGNVAVRSGDEIFIFIPQMMMRTPPPLDIVYSDFNIAVINKAVNVQTDELLLRQVREHFGFALCVHRLDRNTAGLVCFALNQAAYDELSRAFRERGVIKEYFAAVYGRLEGSAEITAYLKKDEATSFCTVSGVKSEGYKKIVTKYESVFACDEYSHLKITLKTGRTHQIRAHMAYIGHFVLGDGKYGNNSVNQALGYKVQQLKATRLVFTLLRGDLAYLNGKEFG